MSEDKKNRPGDPGAPGTDPARDDLAPVEEEGAEEIQRKAEDAEKAFNNAAELTKAAEKVIEAKGAAVYKTTSEMIRLLEKQETKIGGLSHIKPLNLPDTVKEVFQVLLEKLAVFTKELEELEPYIEEELQKPEYGGKTLDDLFDYKTPEEESLFNKALEAAREARRRNIKKPYRPTTTNFPVDRVNLLLPTIFDQPADGQLTFVETFDMNKSGHDDGATLFLSVLFEAGEGENVSAIARRIDHTDIRIMGAISAAMDEGRTVFSLRTIWHALGGKGAPPKSQREKIKKHMDKMRRTIIVIDNEKEAEVYNYYWTNYNGLLLPWESADEVKNGQAETYFHILRYPPLMEFAKRRNQLTKIPLKVLQSPGSNTERKYQIEDYLLYRIVRAKADLAKIEEQQEKHYTKERAGKIKEKRKLTILFTTLLERTGHASARPSWQKRNILDPAEELLNFYASDEAGNYIKAVRKEGATKADKDPVKFVITLK